MIYLDNNATTQIDHDVKEAMDALDVGNPSSMHQFGRRAKQTLLECRRFIADYFGMDEVIFTSGATEALNMVVHSLPKGAHVITSSLEHAAVRESVNAYCEGRVTRLEPMEGRGFIMPEQVEAAIRPETKMILLMGANNETGIVTDIKAIAQIAERYEIDFVVDGVALLGKHIFTLPKGVSAACFSGHKIHGPTGVGALVYRRSFKLKPLIYGGAQQHGLRGGSENLRGVIGFQKALEQICETSIEGMCLLRDQLEKELKHIYPTIEIHGESEQRVSNTSNVFFPGVDGETLLMQLDLEGVAISHGAACSSGALEPSHVLLNMGLSRGVARSSLRFSLSRFTTEDEINQVVKLLTAMDLIPLSPVSSAVNSN